MSDQTPIILTQEENRIVSIPNAGERKEAILKYLRAIVLRTPPYVDSNLKQMQQALHHLFLIEEQEVLRRQILQEIEELRKSLDENSQIRRSYEAADLSQAIADIALEQDKLESTQSAVNDDLAAIYKYIKHYYYQELQPNKADKRILNAGQHYKVMIESAIQALKNNDTFLNARDDLTRMLKFTAQEIERYNAENNKKYDQAVKDKMWDVQHVIVAHLPKKYGELLAKQRAGNQVIYDLARQADVLVKIRKKRKKLQEIDESIGQIFIDPKHRDNYKSWLAELAPLDLKSLLSYVNQLIDHELKSGHVPAGVQARPLDPSIEKLRGLGMEIHEVLLKRITQFIQKGLFSLNFESPEQISELSKTIQEQFNPIIIPENVPKISISTEDIRRCYETAKDNYQQIREALRVVEHLLSYNPKESAEYENYLLNLKANPVVGSASAESLIKRIQVAASEVPNAYQESDLNKTYKIIRGLSEQIERKNRLQNAVASIRDKLQERQDERSDLTTRHLLSSADELLNSGKMDELLEQLRKILMRVKDPELEKIISDLLQQDASGLKSELVGLRNDIRERARIALQTEERTRLELADSVSQMEQWKRALELERIEINRKMMKWAAKQERTKQDTKRQFDNAAAELDKREVQYLKREKRLDADAQKNLTDLKDLEEREKQLQKDQERLKKEQTDFQIKVDQRLMEIARIDNGLKSKQLQLAELEKSLVGKQESFRPYGAALRPPRYYDLRNVEDWAELAPVTGQTNEELKLLQSELQSLKNELQQISNRNAQLASDNSERVSRNSELETEKVKLSSRVSVLEEESAKLLAENLELQNNNRILTTKNSELDAALRMIKSKLVDDERELNELRLEQTELKSELATIQRALSEKELSVLQLGTQNRDLIDKKKTLESLIEESEKRENKLLKDLEVRQELLEKMLVKLNNQKKSQVPKPKQEREDQGMRDNTQPESQHRKPAPAISIRKGALLFNERVAKKIEEPHSGNIKLVLKSDVAISPVRFEAICEGVSVELKSIQMGQNDPIPNSQFENRAMFAGLNLRKENTENYIVERDNFEVFSIHHREKKSIEIVSKDQIPNDDAMYMMVLTAKATADGLGKKGFNVENCENNPAAAFKLFLIGISMGLKPVFKDRANMTGETLKGILEGPFSQVRLQSTHEGRGEMEEETVANIFNIVKNWDMNDAHHLSRVKAYIAQLEVIDEVGLDQFRPRPI